MIELQLNMHSLYQFIYEQLLTKKLFFLSILFLTKNFFFFFSFFFFFFFFFFLFFSFFFSFFSLSYIVSGKRKVSLRYTLKWPADRSAALTAAGIHIHDGLDCTTADGGAHYYDNAKVPDPWNAGTSGNWIASGSAGNWVSFR